jgi:aspartyl-tRNA(Asn)/glutamyl-tRNA(Gln) amidotransferase subunit C
MLGFLEKSECRCPYPPHWRYGECLTVVGLDELLTVLGVSIGRSVRGNGAGAGGRESRRVMPTDRIDIRHVATLARLALTEDEVATYGAQLGNLMTHVDALANLDTAEVPATAQVVPSRNVQRPDALRPETMLTREAALQNAPDTVAGYVRVPRIIGEEG